MRAHVGSTPRSTRLALAAVAAAATLLLNALAPHPLLQAHSSPLMTSARTSTWTPLRPGAHRLPPALPPPPLRLRRDHPVLAGGSPRTRASTDPLALRRPILRTVLGALAALLIMGIACRAPNTVPRWVAAASAGELQSRLRVVDKSKKLTEAMKLVAAARLRRAQRLVMESRPFQEALKDVFRAVLERVPDLDLFDLPLMQTHPVVRRVTLLVIGADRGLCGSYNVSVIRRAVARCAELKAAGYEVDLITIGDRISPYFLKRPAEYTVTLSYMTSTAVPLVPEIVRELEIGYVTQEIDAVEVLYTRFLSLGKTAPSILSLLPFQPTQITLAEDEVWQLTSLEGRLVMEREPAGPPPKLFTPGVLFDQDPEVILETLVPLYLSSQLTRALEESIAAEVSTRLFSMRAANDNANELGKSLRQSYNRLRQSKITSQLLDLLGHHEG